MMLDRSAIVVVGSINTDLVLNIDRAPLAGETRTARRFSTGRGGKGANQAVAAARLGSAVTFVGRVGDDGFGRAALDAFRAEGIDVGHVSTDPDQPSGTATIIVEDNGENRILLAAGANGVLSATDVDRAEQAIRGAALLVLQLEVPLPTVAHAIRLAAACGTPVLLNPAPATPEFFDLPFENVDFLIPNETELALLTGLPTRSDEEVVRAARALCLRGVATVVATRGGLGAMLVRADHAWPVPAHRVEPVDTTGAGDAFIGAFAHRYCAGNDVLSCLAFASRYSAVCVGRPGAQSSYPTIDEFSAA